MENPGNNVEENTNSQHTVSEKIRDYILKNPWFVLWNLSLLVGGIIFWLYFFEIEYFPDLNFQDVVLFLVATSILGLIYVLSITFVLLIPAIIYCIFLGNDGPVLQDERNCQRSNDEEEDKQLIQSFWYFVVLIFVYSLFIYLRAGKITDLITTVRLKIK